MSWSPMVLRRPLLSRLTSESAPTLSGSVSSQYPADVWDATIVGSLPSRSNIISVRSACPRLLIPMVKKSSRRECLMVCV